MRWPHFRRTCCQPILDSMPAAPTENPPFRNSQRSPALATHGVQQLKQREVRGVFL